jgi:protease-4
MGSTAASGGYWIAADADKIYAEPSTITGSIGGFGMFLTADKALNSLGIHTDGLGTTDFTGISPTQPLPDHIKQIVQMNVENTYQRFLDLVAEGRGMTPEQVDKVAQGRVWVGTDAKKLGLVDELGGLDHAAAEASKAQAEPTEPTDQVDEAKGEEGPAVPVETANEKPETGDEEENGESDSSTGDEPTDMDDEAGGKAE